MKELAHPPASGGARLVRKDVRTFADLLRRRAGEQGQTPAFTFLGAEPGGDVTLTYGEVDQWARAIAQELESRGLAGQRVLIVLPPGPAYVASLFGCFYAGVIAVPVPPPLFDSPRAGPGLLSTIAQDSGAAAALVGGPRPAEGQRLTIEGLASHVELIATEGISPAGLSSDWAQPFVDPRAIALLQYTAGSTGSPKGVRVTHAGLLDNAEALRRGLAHTASDKILLWLPAHQGLGLLEGVLQPVCAGIPSVLLPPRAFFQRPVRWLEALSTHGATISGAPDFAYELCVRTTGEDERARLDLSRWRVAISSGEQIRAETMERFSEHFAPCGFNPKAFRPVYGLAESTYLVANSKSEDGPTLRGVGVDALAQQRITERRGAATKLVSCGPTASVQVIIVNPTTRALRSEQEIGEIWVTGLSVADGYWGRVGTTEETFRGRMAGTAAGMRAFLRTGDLGAIAGGDLFVTGRIRDVVIWQGQDLRLHDLEFDVEASHPALVPGSCAAFSLKQGREERFALVAEVFLPESTQAPKEQALLQELARTLRRNVSQRHGVVPAEIALLPAFRLPRSSTGRVSREAVRAAYLASELEPLVRDRGEGPGDGVQATPPPAARGGEEARSEAPSPTELVPLTPAMYAGHDPTRAPSSRAGASRVLELPQGTEALHVEEALHAVWTMHETLRLRYTRSDTGALGAQAALIPPEKGPVPLTRLELASRPDEECWQAMESAARRLATELRQGTGALAGFVLCNRGPRNPPWLLVVCHPALMDESSWRILATDLADTCEQARARGRVRLAPQSGALAQWVQQLITEVHLPRITSQAREHWIARPILPAPGRPLTTGAVTAPAPGALAVVEASALQRAATLFEVSREAILLAACALAYGTHAQRSWVRVSLEQSARGSSHYQVDASRMLGNLDYVFPAVLSLEPEAEPVALARQAHTELLEAPLGGLAYEALRAYGSDRELAEALQALPAADFSLRLEDEGAPSSRRMLRTLAIFESRPQPGASAAPLRVEAQLSAERAQLMWNGDTSDAQLLSALAKLTEQTLHLLIAQAESLRAASAPGRDAALRASTAGRSH
ncbi:MAG: AMP-binding protein [Myxococcaceae bacterium]|nr:AMP-binding protein [Myxococcaceae bacterium]